MQKSIIGFSTNTDFISVLVSDEYNSYPLLSFKTIAISNFFQNK